MSLTVASKVSHGSSCLGNSCLGNSRLGQISPSLLVNGVVVCLALRVVHLNLRNYCLGNFVCSQCLKWCGGQAIPGSSIGKSLWNGIGTGRFEASMDTSSIY